MLDRFLGSPQDQFSAEAVQSWGHGAGAGGELQPCLTSAMTSAGMQGLSVMPEQPGPSRLSSAAGASTSCRAPLRHGRSEQDAGAAAPGRWHSTCSQELRQWSSRGLRARALVVCLMLTAGPSCHGSPPICALPGPPLLINMHELACAFARCALVLSHSGVPRSAVVPAVQEQRQHPCCMQSH